LFRDHNGAGARKLYERLQNEAKETYYVHNAQGDEITWCAVAPVAETFDVVATHCHLIDEYLGELQGYKIEAAEIESPSAKKQSLVNRIDPRSPWTKGN
jgi:hypothetical protein